MQSLRQVRLEDVSGANVLDDPGDRLEIARAREVGAHAGHLGHRIGGGARVTGDGKGETGNVVLQ